MEFGYLKHYRILRKLGEGGMGEIYLAEDTVLDRKVALKILPREAVDDPERMKRFVLEAKAASSLKHPGVAAIHELGEAEGRHFIVMEYVEGETLAARMPHGFPDLDTFLDLAIQIADAIGEAHTQGIIHRDIKPSNIMITPQGRIKVLDFGLAKVTRVPSNAEAGHDDLTKSGIVLGTVQYMSPEQVLGKSVDHRSDLFSLGAVLYEMVTGRLPFLGDTWTERMNQILNYPAPPVSLLNPRAPVEIENVIHKCLEKDAEKRYQSAQELLGDLKKLRRKTGEQGSLSLSSSRFMAARVYRPHRIALFLLVILGGILGFMLTRKSTGNVNSIAVLPFANISNDSQLEVVCDGITDSLIQNLSLLPGMKVISRTSAFQYKAKRIDPHSVGKELDVQALLTGSVEYRDATLSIRTELISTRDNSHLWGDETRHRVEDVLTAQSDIARKISEQLRPALSGEQQARVSSMPTQSNAAYKFYLAGRFHWNKRTSEGIRTAIDYFKQAIEIDPQYALAYAGLSDCYGVLSDYESISPEETAPKTKAAALRALDLDPFLAEARTSYAFYLATYEWDFEKADDEFRKAIELNPNYATARHWYALTLLSSLGRHDESIAEVRKAAELDPLSPIINANVALIYYLARRWDDCQAQAQKVLSVDPEFLVAREYLGWAYAQKGEYDKAIAELNEYSRLPGQASMLANLGCVYAKAGRKAEAEQALMELQSKPYITRFDTALLLANLGRTDEAFEWLEMGYKEHDGNMPWIKVQPLLDPIRTDQRYEELVRRMKLE